MDKIFYTAQNITVTRQLSIKVSWKNVCIPYTPEYYLSNLGGKYAAESRVCSTGNKSERRSCGFIFSGSW